jgi:hypothetical protein
VIGKVSLEYIIDEQLGEFGCLELLFFRNFLIGSFDSVIAAGLPSMIFIGMCFGAPVLNFLAEKIGYFLTIIGAGAVMAASFVFFLASRP